MVLQENFTFDNILYIWQYSLHMTIFFGNLKTLEEQYITLIWDWEQQFEKKAGVTKSIYFSIPFIVHDALNLRVAVNWIPKYVHLAALAFFPNYVPACPGVSPYHDQTYPLLSLLTMFLHLHLDSLLVVFVVASPPPPTDMPSFLAPLPRPLIPRTLGHQR